MTMLTIYKNSSNSP